MAGGGSKLAVYSAIVVNAVVTLVKFVAFAFTGSGAMLAEGMHSAADVGNQALLAVGMRKAERAPDEDHPLGYGGEAFVWSLISAVGMFFLGSGVSITHGVQALAHGEHGEVMSQTLNLGILGFSFVAEGLSFAVALNGMRMDARTHGQGLLEYFRKTDDPFGIAVLLEDSAAILGVTIALVSVALTAATGNENWDSWGSIGIGSLLGLVAVFLVRKNRDLLIGRSVRPEDRETLRRMLAEDPAVSEVKRANAVVTGTSSYGVHTKLDFNGAYVAERVLDGTNLEALRREFATDEQLRGYLLEFGERVVTQVGREIDRIEARIRETMPKATRIDVEVD